MCRCLALMWSADVLENYCSQHRGGLRAGRILLAETISWPRFSLKTQRWLEKLVICWYAVSQQPVILLVIIDEHADTVYLIAADSSQHAIVIFQDDVSVVAKHWRIAVNCHVAGKRLVAGISRLEPTIRLVVFTGCASRQYADFSAARPLDTWSSSQS